MRKGHTYNCILAVFTLLEMAKSGKCDSSNMEQTFSIWQTLLQFRHFACRNDPYLQDDCYHIDNMMRLRFLYLQILHHCHRCNCFCKSFMLQAVISMPVQTQYFSCMLSLFLVVDGVACGYHLYCT